jgi:hypothetical protein
MWYESKVVKIDKKKKRALIGYVGWSARYDVWRPFGDDGVRINQKYLKPPETKTIIVYAGEEEKQ